MRPLRWQHVSVVIQNDVIVAGISFQVCGDFFPTSGRTVNITVNDGEQDGSNANNLVGEKEGMSTNAWIVRISHKFNCAGHILSTPR